METISNSSSNDETPLLRMTVWESDGTIRSMFLFALALFNFTSISKMPDKSPTFHPNPTTYHLPGSSKPSKRCGCLSCKTDHYVSQAIPTYLPYLQTPSKIYLQHKKKEELTHRKQVPKKAKGPNDSKRKQISVTS